MQEESAGNILEFKKNQMKLRCFERNLVQPYLKSDFLIVSWVILESPSCRLPLLLMTYMSLKVLKVQRKSVLESPYIERL